MFYYIYRYKLDSLKDINPLYLLTISFVLYYLNNKFIEKFEVSSIRITKITYGQAGNKVKGIKNTIYNSLLNNYKNITYKTGNNFSYSAPESLNFGTEIFVNGLLNVDYKGEYTYDNIVAFLKNHAIKNVIITRGNLVSDSRFGPVNSFTTILQNNNIPFTITKMSKYNNGNDNKIEIKMELENNGLITYNSFESLGIESIIQKDIPVLSNLITNFKSSI